MLKKGTKERKFSGKVENTEDKEENDGSLCPPIIFERFRDDLGHKTLEKGRQ